MQTAWYFNFIPSKLNFNNTSYALAGAAFGGVFRGVASADALVLDSRSVAALHVREAKGLLTKAGVPIRDRNEILRSFDLETLRVENIQASRTEFRVFDDFDAKIKGRYTSPNLISNQTERILHLALPSNSAIRLAEVSIPSGSTIITGKIAPQLNFGSGLTGGGVQSFLLGPLDSYIFREVVMPREVIKFGGYRV